MLEKKTWEEFRDNGFLWWINMILHTFGWCIVTECENGKITNVYPARTKFRGFPEESNTKGYQNVSKYLKENIEDIEKETYE